MEKIRVTEDGKLAQSEDREDRTYISCENCGKMIESDSSEYSAKAKCPYCNHETSTYWGKNALTLEIWRYSEELDLYTAKGGFLCNDADGKKVVVIKDNKRIKELEEDANMLLVGHNDIAAELMEYKAREKKLLNIIENFSNGGTK